MLKRGNTVLYILADTHIYVRIYLRIYVRKYVGISKYMRIFFQFI